MSAKKPNIIECDGLIIRGRGGEKRASIRIGEMHGDEYVEFELYGVGNDEAAFHASVDAQGRTRVAVDYVGLVDLDGRDFADVAPGVELDSGTREPPARFRVFGRGPGRHDDPVFEIPEKSKDGRRADFIRALVRAGEPYRDLNPLVIADAMEDASEERCDGEVVSVARAKHWPKNSEE